ncbi:hypothetical protein Sjap_021740 [Stephania japonica]|uniref:Uncharacterized protein n=1 Tax=Stephania japonica TaxID=461633 RepID=A0AAP0ET89_9MAGN
MPLASATITPAVPSLPRSTTASRRLPFTEARWGARLGAVPCSRFQKWILLNEMVDLGFYGPKFTWNRGLLFERLDKSLGNKGWMIRFPNSKVYHLAKSIQIIGCYS